MKISTLEALVWLKNGKRMRHVSWTTSSYVYIKKGHLVNQDEDNADHCIICWLTNCKGGWEEYIKPSLAENLQEENGILPDLDSNLTELGKSLIDLITMNRIDSITMNRINLIKKQQSKQKDAKRY